MATGPSQTVLGERTAKSSAIATMVPRFDTIMSVRRSNRSANVPA
jgi:hypothetical protein